MADTPMKRLKDLFKRFELAFQSTILQKKEFSKNLSVENDFIRIYTLKSNSSVGFGFNNNGEQDLITVSFYSSSDLKYSRTFDFETFKTFFKSFINFWNHPLYPVVLEEQDVLKHFKLELNNRDNIKQSFKNKFFEENKEIIDSFNKTKNEKEDAYKTLQAAEIKYREQMLAYSKQLELELGLNDLKENVRKKDSELGDSYFRLFGATSTMKNHFPYVIKNFYNNNEDLKCSLSLDIFKSYLSLEIENKRKSPF